MYKLVVMYRHPKSPEHFRDYYVNYHLPLAARLPGLLASRYSMDLAGVGEPSPYFCIWEGEFADAGAMSEAMASPVGREVGADVAVYATGGVVLLHYQAIETPVPPREGMPQ
jgi:uncharacterized protein (TIGR02118 family)